MPLLGTMLPHAQAAIAGESSGEAAPSNPQTVPETITEPDHSHDHESTPPRPTTTTSSALVNQQKVSTQESEFKAHKLLFKEVVGKLVKKVKLLEDKLKGRQRKFVMTDSDKEEDAEEDVDPLIKLAKAAATAAANLLCVLLSWLVLLLGPSADTCLTRVNLLLLERRTLHSDKETFRQKEEDQELNMVSSPPGFDLFPGRKDLSKVGPTWLHLSRNLVALASASLERQQDLIGSRNHKLKSCGIKTISMRNMINLHTVRDDTLLGTLKFVSKTKDYHKYGALIPDEMINQDIKDSKAYKTYHDFATGKVAPKKARKFKKIASPLKKLSPVLEVEPVKKPKQAKKPAKKSTIVPTACVVIGDTPGVSVSKKKASAKGDRGKGMELLSNAALLKAAHVKEALHKTKKDSHMLHVIGSGDGVGFQPKVPDESEDKTTGNSEDDDSNDDVSDDVSKDDDDNDVDSDADGNNNGSDSERIDSDEEENPNLTLKDDKEKETQDDEYDVNEASKIAEHAEEGKGDAEMADVARDNTDGSMQSSSVSSDFTNKFLNLDNVLLADNEVASMMNVNVHQEESSTQVPPLLTVPVTAISVTSTVAATTVPLTISPFTPIPQLSTPIPIPTTEPTTILIPALLDFSSLFGFDQRVSNLEKELS
ncbi:hypothetical protein Tco_1417415 [Tanacetum coccineum]